jgi:hypothetical protein
LIAATLVYAGVENLIRRNGPGGRRMLAFGFGLIHGLGFAGTLRELKPGGSLAEAAIPLLGFNSGVEFGQICIAAAVLPLIFWVRRRPAFAHLALPGLSIIVSALGLVWFFERLSG